MNRSGLLAFVIIVLSACGADDPECRIRPSGEPGIRLLECPTGTVRIVGGEGEGVCTVTSEKEGWRRVTCSDGTTVLIDPEGQVHFPGSGSIRGMATLVGNEGDNEGIVVRAEGTPFQTKTSADGQFVLEDLPAGLYRLVFEYPGRVPEIRENVPVVNGTYTLEEVPVSPSLRLSSEHGARVIPSPSGESLLVVEEKPTGTIVRLVHLETWEIVHLTSNARNPSYRFDGRKVLWTENLTSRSKVRTYDVDSGEREDLPLTGIDAVYFADGRTILVAQREEYKDRLVAWDTVEWRSIDLGPWSPSPISDLPMGRDGSSVVFNVGSELVLWDRENEEHVVLAGAGSGLQDVIFHPAGRKVAVIQRGSQRSLVLADLSRGTTATLEPRLREPLQALPDGSLLWNGEDDWKLWDGRTGETLPLPLPESHGGASIYPLPDGSGFIHFEYPLAYLMMRDEDHPRLLSANAIGQPKIASDGKHVVLEVLEDRPYTRVFRVEDGSSERLEGVGWSLGPDPGWICRVDSENRLVYYDFAKGKEVEIAPAIRDFSFGGNDTLIVRRLSQEFGGPLGIWERSTGEVRWLGSGNDPHLSRNGRYLFYRACPEEPPAQCNTLYRYDRVTEEVDWISNDTSGVRAMYDRFATFQVGEGEARGLYLVLGEP